jgi:hypothetical protein
MAGNGPFPGGRQQRARRLSVPLVTTTTFGGAGACFAYVAGVEIRAMATSARVFVIGSGI